MLVVLNFLTRTTVTAECQHMQLASKHFRDLCKYCCSAELHMYYSYISIVLVSDLQ